MKSQPRREPILTELRAVIDQEAAAAAPPASSGPMAYAPPAVRERLEEVDESVAELVAAATVATVLAPIPADAGELAGKTIALACQSTAEQVMAAARAALARASQIKREADEFAASVIDIGKAHEQRIIEFTAELEAIQQSLEAGRARLAALRREREP